MTIICRYKLDDIRVLVMPFWSYIEIIEKRNIQLLLDNILNIILFIPIGFLLSSQIKKQRFIVVLLFCFAITIGIEVAQFSMQRGWFEVDDIIHNTLGGLVGMWTFQKMILLKERLHI